MINDKHPRPNTIHSNPLNKNNESNNIKTKSNNNKNNNNNEQKYQIKSVIRIN